MPELLEQPDRMKTRGASQCSSLRWGQDDEWQHIEDSIQSGELAMRKQKYYVNWWLLSDKSREVIERFTRKADAYGRYLSLLKDGYSVSTNSLPSKPETEDDAIIRRLLTSEGYQGFRLVSGIVVGAYVLEYAARGGWRIIAKENHDVRSYKHPRRALPFIKKHVVCETTN
jgi:hypothetical protein